MFVEELEEAQIITCPPMDVELKNTSKPFFARKPRKTPLHWADKVKKEIKKLIKAGIIERIPANESAAWISPAGFMAKDEKEEKLRLICDLRQLNKTHCWSTYATKEPWTPSTQRWSRPYKRN